MCIRDSYKGLDYDTRMVTIPDVNRPALQLGDGGGTVYVAGRQQGALAELAANQARQLGAVGGFTGALKTHHHHNGGRCV